MDKELLLRIYNTLLLIETKGESTMLMADCLRGLQTVINSEVRDEQRNEGQNDTGDSNIA